MQKFLCMQCLDEHHHEEFTIMYTLGVETFLDHCRTCDHLTQFKRCGKTLTQAEVDILLKRATVSNE